ncbi:unnamed protein product [Calypogeia fissa]
MTSPDKDKWFEAMVKEMNSLKKNSTLRLVTLPRGKKLVQCKWVYKKKQDGTYKARLMAKGYTQCKGLDYTEIFSPIVKLATIRVLFAIVAFYDLELDQMDVLTAFLHGLLDVEIYMAQPEGFITKEAGHMVCLLLHSLYGLKQSPRQWNKRFDSFMLSKGFTCSDSDSCIYMKEVENFTSFGYIVLALYVDDMLIAVENKSDVAHLKAMLSKEFSMKDLGQAKKILGMEIHRDQEKRQLWLSQR